MIHLSSKIISRLGVAATFILGTVAGNQFRKHREKVLVDSGSTVELRQEDADEWFIEEKRSSIISKIYTRLQRQSINTACSDGVTESYMEIGKQTCQQYLQYRDLLEESSELWIKKWLGATEWIDTVDFWPRPPALQLLSSPTYFAALFAGVRALWYITCSSDFNKENCLVDTLKHCANNKESQIFLPAWRALHNLQNTTDKKSACRNLYLEGVYPFVLPDKKKAPLVDIILVHGIKGGAAWTWRQHDQERQRPLLSQENRRDILKGLHKEVVDEFYTCCWPLDWLVPSLNIPVRVIAVNFKCGWWRWEKECSIEGRGKSIISHSRDLARALTAAGVGERPIIWISHSMGGLLVKNMLVMDLENEASGVDNEFGAGYREGKCFSEANNSQCVVNNSLAKETLATVFFSVPHHGSPLATYVTQGVLRLLLQPTRELCEMRTDNQALHLLHKSFTSLVKAQDIAVLTLNESAPVLHKTTGYPLHFVPSEFGDPGIGVFYEADSTHLDICKPLNRNSDSYQKVASFLQAALSKLK
ncbi:protein SERAC1 isoform X2 [Procambarus clarkii]|uniref:protein SERAC1 isoform X2 n=1 Tax=Procambarus clarkii TaxID=6728 RepID=UPI00374490C3